MMNDGEADGEKRCCGKFQGTVVTNVDPLGLGRVLVKVPDVLGPGPCIWAQSASPLAGPQMGLYLVPPPGSGVWVEFLGGDPNHAVWTGCWRDSAADVPLAATTAPPLTPPIVLQSPTQTKIVVSSIPGDGVRLELATGKLGPYIEITALGITIAYNPTVSITLTAAGVMINQGALFIK